MSNPGGNPATDSQQSLLRRIAARFHPGRHFIDPKFSANRRRYVAQCGFVSLAMLVVLLMLDLIYQTVLIAALGASCFVAFAAPSMRVSRPRCLIGGYTVGVMVGCAVSALIAVTVSGLMLDEHTVRILLGAAAVGMAMFIMVTTDTEHPPGAAVALGFVLNDWEPMTIVIVMAGIVVISVIKELARDRLIDLL